MLKMPTTSRFTSPKAVIDSGTSCKLSERRSAVTTTSSSGVVLSSAATTLPVAAAASTPQTQDLNRRLFVFIETPIISHCIEPVGRPLLSASLRALSVSQTDTRRDWQPAQHFVWRD